MAYKRCPWGRSIGAWSIIIFLMVSGLIKYACISCKDTEDIETEHAEIYEYIKIKKKKEKYIT